MTKKESAVKFNSRLDNQGFASIQIRPVITELKHVIGDLTNAGHEVDNITDMWLALSEGDKSVFDRMGDPALMHDAMLKRHLLIYKRMDRLVRYLLFSTDHKMSYSQFKRLKLVGAYRMHKWDAKMQK